MRCKRGIAVIETQRDASLSGRRQEATPAACRTAYLIGSSSISWRTKRTGGAP